ncbi:MAG TPA: MBL fold metallo-hydrolase [Bryobacteraceae bacterium]|nr:MBL fold metallo-hydrolase [Bryobacteraceae bacterium]
MEALENTLSGQPARYAGGLHAIGQDVLAWLTPNGGWGESNAALISGHNASLLVDTLWDLSRTTDMLNAFQPKLESAPVKQLVNTHADGDHWFGNGLVDAGQIISTKAASRHMTRQGPSQMRLLPYVVNGYRLLSYMPLPHRQEWRIAAEYLGAMLRPFHFGDIRPAPPTNTFTGRLQLDVGGRQVTLIEVGPAHTSGDLIVHLPDAHVVFAGDVLFHGTVPLLWDGSSRNWIRACERILELKAETILPGHGPITGPNGVDAVRRYWQFLRTAVRQHFEKGRPAYSASAHILRSDEYRKQPFAKWDGQERIVINVHAIYRRLLGRKRSVSVLRRLKLLREAALLAEELAGD